MKVLWITMFIFWCLVYTFSLIASLAFNSPFALLVSMASLLFAWLNSHKLVKAGVWK